MTHDEAAAILVDALPGRLTPAALARVSGHLETCEECREVLETIETLRGEARHLPVARIVELAAGGAGDPHLATCAPCAEEVAACRAALAGARAGRKKTNPFIPAALAAALMVAVLGYPAYLGLVELPRARRQVEPAAAPAPASPAPAPAPDRGEVALALYLTGTRGSAAPPAIELTAGARFVTLLVEPVAPRAAADGEPLRFEVRDAAGRVAWSSETTAGALRRRGGSAESLVTLLVPVSALAPGSYALSLSRPGQGAGEALIDAAFVVTSPTR